MERLFPICCIKLKYTTVEHAAILSWNRMMHDFLNDKHAYCMPILMPERILEVQSA